MFGVSRGSCTIDRQGFASTGLTAGPDSALWVHSPRKEEAVPVLQEGVREVRAKKLTLNLKKCDLLFCRSP
jgi:hypothetical protein